MSTSKSLQRILNKISKLVEQGYIKEAQLLLSELEKKKIKHPDMYTLQAMCLCAQDKLNSAISHLKKGVVNFPHEVDLFINLALFYERKGNYIEAYHFFMKSEYVNNDKDKREIIVSSLRRLKPFFKGWVWFDSSQNKIVTRISSGDNTIETNRDLSKARKHLGYLNAISAYLSIDAVTILEIDFGTGVLSKNLNLYGYEVEAVDADRKSILDIFCNEWQENLRNPDQKKASYFYKSVKPEDVTKMKHYDVVIFLPKQSSRYRSNSDLHESIVSNFLYKGVKQLFTFVDNTELSCIVNKYNGIYLVKPILTEGSQALCLFERNDVLNNRFFIPQPDNIGKRNSSIMEVDINKCIDNYGFSYRPGGFHPFVAAVNQLEVKPNLDYKDSVLNRFYECFQPENLYDALELQQDFFTDLKRGWIGYPWHVSSGGKQVSMNEWIGTTREGGNHFFGPNTEDFGAEELKRLVTNLRNIKEVGYIPEVFSDGYVTGYLLKQKDDYRFVITEGQHRIAVMASLGYSKIKVRFSTSEKDPRIVRRKLVESWSQVQNGVYSKLQAGALFDIFFKLNGIERVKDLGFKENSFYASDKTLTHV
ncbi:tetratricopeptide repeat protein [Alteribacter natronophilus]|uniref:tetratricopeptide repeat protein n=1 Tax=Alteribacter natronophilus TaxID=2583810 RepID=UPI00110EFB8D|nr:hypothetical protein [Alteribacter natronophilus]TMW72380.1 hypothetical protein FGB90_09250 [Alteribacter natronophilus]